MRKIFLAGVFAAVLVHAFLLQARAGTLTIGNGSTLDINGGSLLMNCQDITITNGGTLLLQSGSLIRRNLLTVETGGIYSVTGGTETDCAGKSFFLIFNSEGRPMIYCLPKS